MTVGFDPTTPNPFQVPGVALRGGLPQGPGFLCTWRCGNRNVARKERPSPYKVGITVKAWGRMPTTG